MPRTAAFTSIRFPRASRKAGSSTFGPTRSARERTATSLRRPVTRCCDTRTAVRDRSRYCTTHSRVPRSFAPWIPLPETSRFREASASQSGVAIYRRCQRQPNYLRGAQRRPLWLPRVRQRRQSLRADGRRQGGRSSLTAASDSESSIGAERARSGRLDPVGRKVSRGCKRCDDLSALP